MKQLLYYVKGTVDQVIVFPKTDGSGLQLTVFSDADMAGDIDGFKHEMMARFKMSDLGMLSYYLGIEVR